MHSLRDEITQSFRTAPLFALAVLLTLGVTGIIGLMVFLMVVLKHGFMGMTHGTDPSHRVHDLTFGFLFGVTVMGLLAQLRRPWTNVAGMLMALIPWGGLLLAGILSADVYRVMVINPSRLVAPAAVVTALLHPTGRAFFRSFSVARVNWVMLALVIIASVPLLAFTIVNIRLQRTVPDDHAAMGHYGFMAAFGFTVIGVSLLASLRPDGWRLTAWVAGILPTLLGLISLAYPGNASSLSWAWALAAIAWGGIFVAAATPDTATPRLLGTWTIRKFAFVGIVAAVMFMFWAVADVVLAIGLGLGTGGPANFFTLPMLMVLAALVLDEKGAMILPVFIFSLLVLPLSALGGPGFFLKVPILVIPFVVAEPLFWLLKKRPTVASAAAGALAGFLIVFLLNALLVKGTLSLHLIVGPVEAAAGGLVGHWIYTKIRDRSFSIAWFQESQVARTATAPRQPQQPDATKETRMTERTPSPDSGADTSVVPGRKYPGTPHRVNLFGVILLILLLLFMIMMLIGGGHGPGRHLPFGDSGSYPWLLL